MDLGCGADHFGHRQIMTLMVIYRKSCFELFPFAHSLATGLVNNEWLIHPRASIRERVRIGGRANHLNNHPKSAPGLNPARGRT